MAYAKGTRLPYETASKLGHLDVIKSDWVRSLVNDFENINPKDEDNSHTKWTTFTFEHNSSLNMIWAVDGSYVTIRAQENPPKMLPSKEVTFVKTALLTIDKRKIEQLDQEHPHPLLLQDILSNSAIFHATVFPLKNIQTSLGSNYDAIRNIVNDSIKIDEDGAFYDTLKWLAYKKWTEQKVNSPGFQCPHLDCQNDIKGGLPFDSDEANCPFCGKQVFLSDMLGLHLDMTEESASERVASAYMLIMEHLMLFTAIRLLWNYPDQKILSETLFIKDGPLSLRSQYSKIVPNIREFLEFAKKSDRLIHIIGQEKSGFFVDHLNSIARFTAPFERGEDPSYSVLTHEYVHKEVYQMPNIKTPYGLRTNWGEKVYVKIEPGTHMVLSIPTGSYDSSPSFPSSKDLIGLDNILKTLLSLVSRKHEGGLYPIELANGIASMSDHPSAAILKNFISDKK